MDIPGRKKAKVGSCIRDKKPSLVRVACASRRMLDDVIQGVEDSPGIQKLLEYAAQNMIIEGVSFPEPGIEQKDGETEESFTTCAHSCAHHAKLMNISLWSKLPEELQELVFARLPWSQIYRVRFLSKGWNQKLVSGAKDSQFQKACVRAQPKSFAELAWGYCAGSFDVAMFDIASNRWHVFETSPRNFPKCDETEIEVLSASDGGLVCFLSKVRSRKFKKNPPWVVFVCNPLTRVWKQLPPFYGIVQQKIMVQLIMNHVTRHYRVIVVGYGKDPKMGSLVNVYHSETGQWTKADGSSSKEVIYGYLYKFHFKPVPCSYNFADGLVHEIGDNYSFLVRDHLFRLKDGGSTGGLRTRCIEEYQAVNCGASWTPLKEYPLNRLPSNPHINPDDSIWFLDFRVCKNFLLLFVLNAKDLRHEFLFIYEFSREEWRELPMMPGGFKFWWAQKQMCELRFDSVP